MENILLKDVPPAVITIVAIYILYRANQSLEKQIETLQKELSSLNKKIEQISTDFITKEEHYKDVSGWRGELNRLEDRIERVFERIVELIKLLEAKREK
jgi:peptidoglycan hydrolase CwlO-like protein